MSAKTEQAARHYLERGLVVVPVPLGEKNPGRPGWERLRITEAEIPRYFHDGQNIGVHCGEPSGWFVCADLDKPEALKLGGRFLPQTLTSGRQGTPDSHWWYYAVNAEHHTFKDLDGSMILELRSTGHHTLVAPSKHPSGERYEWSRSGLEAETVGAGELAARCRELATAALIARHLPKAREEGGGGRHDLALALGGFMYRNGVGQDLLLKILVGAWQVRGASREALRDLEGIVRDTAARIDAGEPATGGRRLEELAPRLPRQIGKFLGWERPDMREQRRHYEPSDVGNADRFVDLYGGVVRWCPARKSWLLWNGERWAWDERGELVKLAHKTARSIYRDAENEPGPDKQKQIAKFALASQNEARINAMMNQSKPYLAVGMDELDTDRWVLNFQNGTMDLKSGKLKAHDPADLITRILPVGYDPNASAPRFERFLKETLVDDAVIRFVKRYSGYTATGITRERMLAILYGSGKNGKTTLVELLQDALGDYATNTDVETLLIKKNQTVGNDVAALKGARFVSASEVEHNRRLAESKVKQLTGRDTVTARFLFGEFFDFIPEFKLWLSTNNKPVILGTDDAIWDRLRLIPFNVRFDGPSAEANLPEQLRAELPGVLAWIVEGCLEWQEHGLQEPEQVTEATKQYREEMDTLAAFIEERCVIREDAIAPATPLYKQYRMWCDDAGEKPETQKMFGMRLRDRGFENGKIKSGPNKDRKGWFGMGIRADDPGPDDPPGADDDGGVPPGFGSAKPKTAAPEGGEGPLRGQRADDGPPAKTGNFAGNSSKRAGPADDSGPKNSKVCHEKPRVSGGSRKRSARSAPSADTLSTLLESRPDWLTKQAAECVRRGASASLLKALAAAVADEALDNPSRADEVLPFVRDNLAELAG